MFVYKPNRLFAYDGGRCIFSTLSLAGKGPSPHTGERGWGEGEPAQPFGVYQIGEV
jgi:hypothetical protein